jgi:hypothetical protein
LNFIKLFLQKFGSGLFIGIVAGATAGFIFAAIYTAYVQSMWNGDAKLIEQLSITQDREVTRNGRTIILGNVKNNTEDSIRMFKIKVDLYDANGTYVEQCTDYVSDLHGGKQTNFKVVCKSCESNQTVEHASYKIYAGGF